MLVKETHKVTLGTSTELILFVFTESASKWGCRSTFSFHKHNIALEITRDARECNMDKERTAEGGAGCWKKPGKVLHGQLNRICTLMRCLCVKSVTANTFLYVNQK